MQLVVCVVCVCVCVCARTRACVCALKDVFLKGKGQTENLLLVPTPKFENGAHLFSLALTLYLREIFFFKGMLMA